MPPRSRSVNSFPKKPSRRPRKPKPHPSPATLDLEESEFPITDYRKMTPQQADLADELCWLGRLIHRRDAGGEIHRRFSNLCSAPDNYSASLARLKAAHAFFYREIYHETRKWILGGWTPRPERPSRQSLVDQGVHSDDRVARVTNLIPRFLPDGEPYFEQAWELRHHHTGIEITIHEGVSRRETLDLLCAAIEAVSVKWDDMMKDEPTVLGLTAG